MLVTKPVTILFRLLVKGMFLIHGTLLQLWSATSAAGACKLPPSTYIFPQGPG